MINENNVLPHKDYLSRIGKRYSDLDKAELKEYCRLYYVAYPQRKQATQARAKERQRRLRESRDLTFRLQGWLKDARRRSEFLKQPGRFKDVVGCSVDDFVKHIESQWVEGMSWDNWGRGNGKDVWHIDHIIPVSDGARCTNHYSNLRPLWACDNRGRAECPRQRKFNIKLTLPGGSTECLSFNSVEEYTEMFCYNHNVLQQLYNGDEVIIKRRNMYTRHTYPVGTIMLMDLNAV